MSYGSLHQGARPEKQIERDNNVMPFLQLYNTRNVTSLFLFLFLLLFLAPLIRVLLLRVLDR